MNRLAVARIGILLATLLFVTRPAVGGELLLKGGGRVSGVIVEKTAATITIETSPGRVTLALSRVEKVLEGRSALEVWRERADALAPGDLEGWAALARWADDQRLMTQGRESWQHVLSLDPQHPEANAALDRVSVDGTWMPRDDAYRAQGFVQYEGRWVSPAERAALEQERLAEAEQARLRREAALRTREAEARAREAEALARQAEAAGSSYGDGIPLWWGGGASYGPVDRPWHDGHSHDGAPHRGHEGHAPPVVAVPTSTPPSSISGSAAPHAGGSGAVPAGAATRHAGT